jgi:hypothetical protein
MRLGPPSARRPYRRILAADAHAGEGFASFSEMYLHCMAAAAELAATIYARQKLRLGANLDPTWRDPCPSETKVSYEEELNLMLQLVYEMHV